MDLEIEGPTPEMMATARLLSSLYGDEETEDALREVLHMTPEQIAPVMQQLHAHDN